MHLSVPINLLEQAAFFAALSCPLWGCLVNGQKERRRTEEGLEEQESHGRGGAESAPHIAVQSTVH